MDPPSNPNQNSNFVFSDEYENNFPIEFGLSDYLISGDCLDEDIIISDSVISNSTGKVINGESTGSTRGAIFGYLFIYLFIYLHICGKCRNGAKKKMDTGQRIAFKIQSELEVLDDGFKWRKYGKKSVKNSPNPRNYYKCSNVGCHVKKRVERDREDASYVITTYEGVHSHESPYIVYYNRTPLMLPAGYALQPASQSSSSQ
ncbi:WRKY domain [Dillenia turbinata]|uniref:WRKY domain n=1 Tax=Dillenia turbinata TaxID=194707 RepID=A0AAN8VBE0_9MAGN